MSNYALRLPNSLFEYARLVAKDEQISINQLFVTAIAEKIASLKTESYFTERAQRAEPGAFAEWLAKSPDVPPMAGDEF